MSVAGSVGAVLAGAVTGIVLTIGTDTMLRAAGIFPPPGAGMTDGMFALATAYRTLYGVAGCYVTARLAERRPMMHVMILAGIGLAATVAGAVMTWDKGPEFGPKWYPLTLIALTLPQSWVGGKLGARETVHTM